MDTPEAQAITIEQLRKVYEELAKDELILDVRTPEEYWAGHIPSSLNIPCDQLAEYLAALESAKTLYIYCHSGPRAQYAATILAQLNKTVFFVGNGGMPKWVSLDYPIEHGNRTKPSRD